MLLPMNDIKNHPMGLPKAPMRTPPYTRYRHTLHGQDGLVLQTTCPVFPLSPCDKTRQLKRKPFMAGAFSSKSSERKGMSSVGGSLYHGLKAKEKRNPRS